MTAKTRRFVFGSLAVLVVGFCTGLVAYFGGLPTGAFVRQSGPAELSYVPADAAVIAYANVHDVMASDLRQKLRAILPPNEKGREDFLAQTGIDIENDIDYVVACMLPREGQESGFVALKGRFDAVRLEALARERHHATVATYKNARILQFENAPVGEPGHHRVAPALAFVEPGLIMVGDEPGIRRAIDTHAAGQNVTDNDEVTQLIKDVDGGANAWAVGRLDVLASHARLPAGVASQIPAVKWFAAAGHINGGLSGTVRAEARDEQAAKNLRDVVNGFLALARLQSGDKPELQTLMQSVTLGGAGKTVELSFTIPPEMIDLLQNMKGTKRQSGALD